MLVMVHVRCACVLCVVCVACMCTVRALRVRVRVR